MKALGTEFDSFKRIFSVFFSFVFLKCTVLLPNMVNLLPEYWWEETETVVGKGVLWDQGGRENKIHSPFSLAFLPLPPHWRRRNVPFSVSLSLSLFPLFFLFSFHVEKRKEEGRRRPPPQLQHTKHYTTTHRFPPTYIRRPISKRCECMHAKGKERRRPSLSTDEVRSPPSFLWRRRSPGSAIPPSLLLLTRQAAF